MFLDVESNKGASEIYSVADLSIYNYNFSLQFLSGTSWFKCNTRLETPAALSEIKIEVD